uniref:Ig-like domain-containing protein n=1 Tax=Sinocyclocheilus grahami TaxID=75366 RepID=A0A672KE65_SINGR
MSHYAYLSSCWCCSFPSAAVRPHLSLQKLNSSNDTCVHLLCLLESLKPEQVNFTWSRGERSLHPFTSYAMNSELHLCKPDWSEGDTITCYASYSSTQTLYTHKPKEV